MTARWRTVDPSGRRRAEQVDLLHGRLRVLTYARIAEVCGVSERAVQRWASCESKPRPAHLTTLARLADVMDDLTGTYTDEGVDLWLVTPKRALDHDSPWARLAVRDFAPVKALTAALDGQVAT